MEVSTNLSPARLPLRHFGKSGPNQNTSRQTHGATFSKVLDRRKHGQRRQFPIAGRELPLRPNPSRPDLYEIDEEKGLTAAGGLPSCPVDGAQSFATSYAPQSMGAKPACLIIPSTHVLP
jgi:hypothetical protein